MVQKENGYTAKSQTIPTVTVTLPPSQLYTNQGEPNGAPFGGGSLVVDSGNKSIVYTTKRLRDRNRSNWCRQVYNRRQYTGYPSNPERQELLDFSHLGWYYMYYGHVGHSLIAHEQAETEARASLGVLTGTAVLDLNAQSYVNDAFDRCQPDLTQMSLPNFLYDIKQITSLFDLWSKRISSARNLAGAHLNYKYGWKPTLGDLTSVIETMATFRRRLKTFKSLLGVKIKDTKSNLNRTVQKSGTFNYQGDSHQPCHWNVLLTQKVHSYFTYYPKPVTAMGPLDEFVRSTMDAYGFELNAQTVWDAIPFSFVVDYFLTVGKFLSHFKVDALELPIYLADSCVQHKQELTISSFLTLDQDNPGARTAIVCPDWITQENLFQRMPVFPDYATLASLKWKRPSGTQALLLASLATVLRK